MLTRLQQHQSVVERVPATDRNRRAPGFATPQVADLGTAFVKREKLHGLFAPRDDTGNRVAILVLVPILGSKRGTRAINVDRDGK